MSGSGEERGSIAGEVNCLLAWNEWLSKAAPDLLQRLRAMVGPDLEPMYALFKAGWTAGVDFVFEELDRERHSD